MADLIDRNVLLDNNIYDGCDVVYVDAIKNAPTVDAVPVAHLADLLERWNWACAMCTHSVDCDKCGLNRCINELKEIINSSTRKKGDSDVND